MEKQEYLCRRTAKLEPGSDNLISGRHKTRENGLDLFRSLYLGGDKNAQIRWRECGYITTTVDELPNIKKEIYKNMVALDLKKERTESMMSVDQPNLILKKEPCETRVNRPPNLNLKKEPCETRFNRLPNLNLKNIIPVNQLALNFKMERSESTKTMDHFEKERPKNMLKVRQSQDIKKDLSFNTTDPLSVKTELKDVRPVNTVNESEGHGSSVDYVVEREIKMEIEPGLDEIDMQLDGAGPSQTWMDNDDIDGMTTEILVSVFIIHRDTTF
jgi:hypothetical protein